MVREGVSVEVSHGNSTGMAVGEGAHGISTGTGIWVGESPFVASGKPVLFVTPWLLLFG